MDSHDLIVIGGGAAGLGAALYAARFRLNVIALAKEFGGTGNIAHRVDNWIGEPGISGFDLMQKFIEHVKQYDVPMIQAEVTAVSKVDGGFEIVASEKSYRTKMILFSNGMMHRKLGVPGEEEYAGRGVHYCYTCDGPLYRGKRLAVIGGSDAAALGTVFLSEYATQVHAVFRRERLTAEPVSVEQVAKLKNVELLAMSNVAEIIGDGSKVTQLKLDTGRVFDIDGIFIEIGHLPLNKLALGLGVETDKKGFIKVNNKQETSVPGVLAAGDITNATELKQFITSAAEGSIAAQTAYHTLSRER
ncbi:MAG: NAD(P)/FAD-dependent oxidoreductase [Patescibacteria group bacterium]